MFVIQTRNYCGEPERAPQFGGSSSSSAMHHGRLYVRTRNFSYSDLNPTGFSPRTAYFENFRSYRVQWFTVNFTGLSRSHRLTIFHATCDEIYSSCQITNGNWNGQYYLQWSVLLSPSQFYFTRFLHEWVADQILMQRPISIWFGLNIL
jgi:hypothetical protein